MAKIIWKGCPNQLPVQVEYTPVDSSERVYYLAGSAFTTVGAVRERIIGFKASIDNRGFLTTEIYSNSEGVHRATVPGMNAFKIPLELEMHDVDGESVPVLDTDGSLQAKTVIITIDKINDSTKTDVNDRLVFAHL